MLKDFLKRREVKIFLTIWLIYIFFISDYGGNWMADSMLSSTLSIINEQTFFVDNYVKEGCKVIGCDFSFYNGHFYSGFAPGASLIAVPVLFLFSPLFELLPAAILSYQNVQVSLILANIFSIIFISSFLSAALAVVLYSFSKYFTKNKKIRLLVPFVFAFGTLFFVYSTEYNPRVIATFFSFCSFFLLFRAKHLGLKKRDLFLAGLFAGISVFVEYTQAIIVVFLVIYLLSFLRTKEVLYFLGGGILILLALGAYHQFIFGSPLSTAYDYRAYNFTADVELGRGFYGAFLPSSEAIYGLSISPEKGLLVYVPISILSLVGLFFVLRNRGHKYFTEMLIVGLLVLALFLHNSSLVAWRANCAFGPRYLIALMPFLVLSAIFIFERMKFKFAILISGVSVFVNFLPVLYGTTVLWRSFEGVGCNSANAIFKEYIPLLFKRGLTNYTLNLIKFRIYDVPVYLMNLITVGGLIVLGVIIWFIWKK